MRETTVARRKRPNNEAREETRHNAPRRSIFFHTAPDGKAFLFAGPKKRHQVHEGPCYRRAVLSTGYRGLLKEEHCLFLFFPVPPRLFSRGLFSHDQAWITVLSFFFSTVSLSHTVSATRLFSHLLHSALFLHSIVGKDRPRDNGNTGCSRRSRGFIAFVFSSTVVLQSFFSLFTFGPANASISLLLYLSQLEDLCFLL